MPAVTWAGMSQGQTPRLAFRSAGPGPCHPGGRSPSRLTRLSALRIHARACTCFPMFLFAVVPEPTPGCRGGGGGRCIAGNTGVSGPNVTEIQTIINRMHLLSVAALQLSAWRVPTKWYHFVGTVGKEAVAVAVAVAVAAAER
eukprot:355149-Chlamydomonas_euryale.AAC.6